LLEDALPAHCVVEMLAVAMASPPPWTTKTGSVPLSLLVQDRKSVFGRLAAVWKKPLGAEEEAVGKPPVPTQSPPRFEKNGSEKRAAGTIVCHLQLHQRGINGPCGDLMCGVLCRETLKEQN